MKLWIKTSLRRAEWSLRKAQLDNICIPFQLPVSLNQNVGGYLVLPYLDSEPTLKQEETKIHSVKHSLSTMHVK